MTNEQLEQVDPVCAMKVDSEKSQYRCNNEGQEYFFCSVHCLESFKKNPQKYLQKQPQNQPLHVATEYTCPMDPQIIQDHPGNCPICGMALESKMIETAPHDDSEYKNMFFRFWIGMLFSIPVVVLAMSSMFPAFDHSISSNLSRWLQFLLSTPVVLWAGWPFFQRGWQSIVNHCLNMFSLVSLGIGVAYIYSLIVFFFPHLFPSTFLHEGEMPLYFETAAMITVLVLLGQVLELKARSQTSQAIKALLGRSAKSARIIENGIEREIPIDQVKAGDILRVRPGEKIPVDGSLIEGKSFVDESMMTGESIPTKKEMHDAVIGGSINQNGCFLMRAEKVGSETLLSRIVQMVVEAQRSRAPIQSLVDLVSSYFVPTVLCIALLTFIIWAWIGPEPSFVYGLINAVAVLIIACPCALGLATPMSIMVGMGRGAEAGVLIKNASALEKLEKVKTIIVDKTGTLTEGKPKITDIISLEAGKENEVLQYAAAVEQNSEHPLAHSLMQGAKERFIRLAKVENFHSFTGRGVYGLVEGHEVLAGNLKLLEERKVNGLAILVQKTKELQNQAQTVIFVAIDGQSVGLIAVSDPIKTSSLDAVRVLHKLGLHIIMLSGDNEETAWSIAKTLGIDEVHAHVLPGYKQEFIKQKKKEGAFVAMAGDGINDAPALAAADVGIAMGTGTDVAMESADVTLVKGDLMGIVRGVALSHAMMRNIRQNLFLAFIYNSLGIPIAAGLFYPFTGLLLSPIVAAFAMSLSSVSVIVNALRLRRINL